MAEMRARARTKKGNVQSAPEDEEDNLVETMDAKFNHTNRTQNSSSSRLETIVCYFITVAVSLLLILRRSRSWERTPSIHTVSFPCRRNFLRLPYLPFPPAVGRAIIGLNPTSVSPSTSPRSSAAPPVTDAITTARARSSVGVGCHRKAWDRAGATVAGRGAALIRPHVRPSVRPSVRRPVARERRMWRVRARAMAAAGEMGERVNTEEID